MTYQNNDENNTSNNLTVKPINILVTENDKNAMDISLMSNFYELSIQEHSKELMQLPSTSLNSVENVATINQISDVIEAGKILNTPDMILLPDMDRLPNTIKEKLKTGEYAIGSSKQNEGNLRAVIVDVTNNNQRVKDITLKQVQQNKDTSALSKDFALQMQLKDLSQKLDSIQALQAYQIDLTRNQTIVNPFLESRNELLMAQNATSQDEQNRHLERARDKMNKAIIGIYSDMQTTYKHLGYSARIPFVRDILLKNLTTDLQYVNKCIGIQSNIYYYLGETSNLNDMLSTYHYNIDYFFNKPITNKGLSAIDILQNYYPYQKHNKDLWYNLAIEMKPKLTNTKWLEEKNIYVITCEEEEGNE